MLDSFGKECCGSDCDQLGTLTSNICCTALCFGHSRDKQINDKNYINNLKINSSEWLLGRLLCGASQELELVKANRQLR